MNAPVYGVPAHIENWATVIAGLGACASLVFCVRYAVTRSAPWAMYLWIGAALTVWIEPFPDVLGRAVFAEVHRIPWITALGRHIPMYIGLTYMFYMAPAYILLIDLFRRGATTRQFAWICAGLVGATWVFEVVPLHYDLWRYYGSQGAQLGKVPIWWGFINAHGIVATAVVAYLLLELLPTNRHVVLVLLVPPVFLAVHTAGAFLGYLAVGSSTAAVTTKLGTGATCVLCVAWFWVYSRIVCRRADAAVASRQTVLSAARS